MSTQPTPLPSLSDAITAVEQADNAYLNAVAQTGNDQATAAAIQSKLDAQNATVASDQQVQATAAASEVAVLQTLDAVVQARIAALTPYQVSCRYLSQDLVIDNHQ